MTPLRFPRLASRLAAGLVALATLALAPMARAGDRVFWSIGVAPAPGVYVGASNAPATVVVLAPIYLRPTPQPVYVHPGPHTGYGRPVPQAVYVAPDAVYGSPPAYLVQPAPAFVPPGHQRHGHRHWHRGQGRDHERDVSRGPAHQPGYGHGRWEGGGRRG